MADDNTTIQTSGGTSTVTAGDGVVIDPNKSAEQYMAEIEDKYIIPALIRQKFPDLIKLIYETESMNEEEREYWLQIMPIMTEEQISKFRDILVNEKSQLRKLDQDYNNEMSRIQNNKPVEIDEVKLKEQLGKIREEEAVNEKSEEKDEKDLLKQIEGMEDK